MATYPDVAVALQEQAEAYRTGTLPLEAIQAAIWQTAGLIVDVEEAETRDQLLAIESRLELLAFTTDRDRLFTATLASSDDLDSCLRRYLNSPG